MISRKKAGYRMVPPLEMKNEPPVIFDSEVENGEMHC